MPISRIAFSLPLGLFAIAAVGSGLDRISANSAAVGRLVPSPLRAQADRAAASDDLARKQNADALEHAGAAVLHDPIDPSSAALLGSARLISGDENGAAAAFRVAARFGWRNVATQLYWYDASLQVGDFRVAGDRADAILRAHPAFADRDILLAPLENDPTGRMVLIDHLRQKPAWLGPYLALDPFSDDVADRRVRVLTQMGEARIPLGCREVALFVGTILGANRRKDAEQVWNAHCPARPIGGLLADPKFELVDVDEPFPFRWQAQRSGEVSVRREQSGRGGSVLVLSNSSPVTQTVLSQPVALPPGKYLLQAAVSGNSGSGRLVASLGCNGSLPFPDRSGDLARGSQIFEVGECPRQLFGLWLTGGGSSVELASVELSRIQ